MTNLHVVGRDEWVGGRGKEGERKGKMVGGRGSEGEVRRGRRLKREGIVGKRKWLSIPHSIL